MGSRLSPKYTKNSKEHFERLLEKRKRKKEKSRHYVDSKVFFNQLVEYYKSDIIPDDLASAVCKIANGLSFAPNFINYSYKDEMVGDAVVKMFSALKNKKFDVSTQNNPFSYFTTIAFHAFINRIKKEKRYRETITKYQDAVYMDALDQTGKSPSAFGDVPISNAASND